MERKGAKPAAEQIIDRLEITCPECSGVTTWKLLQALNRCSYCGSALYRVYHEDQPQFLVAEPTVRDEAELIDVLATYDAMRTVSRSRADLHEYDDSNLIPVELGSAFSDTEVYEVKERRKHLFRMVEFYPIHVPYLLLCSTLVFHCLGRTSGGDRKIYRSLFFTSEDVLPAYAQPWDFRDRGLLISLQNLKAFDPEMQKHSRFLPVHSEIDVSANEVRWKNQRRLLTNEMDPICFDASLVMLRKWIVFRPYAFAHAQTPDGLRWYLIDQQFGTIAGDPRTDELQRVCSKGYSTLQVTSDLLLDVKAIPFRCPECGWDVQMNTRSTYQICESCTRLLETTAKGLGACAYRILQGQVSAGAWLPFWFCRFRSKFEGKTYDDLSALMNALVPPTRYRKISLHQNWNSVFIPAFESWTYARYDQWAFQKAIQLTDREITFENELVRSGSMVPPYYDAETVRSLFPRIVPFYFPAPIHSQLNAMLLQRLAEMEIDFTEMELIYVPIAAEMIDLEAVKTGSLPAGLLRSSRRYMAMAEERDSNKSSPRRSRSFFSDPL